MNISEHEEIFMSEALKEAEASLAEGEIPVGAVIVKDGKIIGRGRNMRERNKDLFSHAEINALKEASLHLKDWRLEECAMYVTLEPCPMCAGAILQSRLKSLCFGALSPREGCAGSIVNILDFPGMSWQVEVNSGLLKERCENILKKFFDSRRSKY
ncbi:tRNA adenosine(34) deaminase TadA [bacterium]|nr:tRNA adenosine(34) deaminase TadA [bacterium]